MEFPTLFFEDLYISNLAVINLCSHSIGSNSTSVSSSFVAKSGHGMHITGIVQEQEPNLPIICRILLALVQDCPGRKYGANMLMKHWHIYSLDGEILYSFYALWLFPPSNQIYKSGGVLYSWVE